jgi:adenosylmethionine-8-amino-7-oxononanoate aminotransferase
VRIRDEARRRGLLLRASHWMFVLAPPLILSDGEVDEIVGIVGEACDAVLPGIPAGAGSVPVGGA